MSLCMSVTQYYFKVRCYGTLTGIKMLYSFPQNWFHIIPCLPITSATLMNQITAYG